MRLLLLLSALLSALSGVGGTRAQAHPVQASAAVAIAAASSASVAATARRFVVAPFASVPPRRLAEPRPIAAGLSRLLYADRRRE